MVVFCICLLSITGSEVLQFILFHVYLDFIKILLVASLDLDKSVIYN